VHVYLCIQFCKASDSCHEIATTLMPLRRPLQRLHPITQISARTVYCRLFCCLILRAPLARSIIRAMAPSRGDFLEVPTKLVHTCVPLPSCPAHPSAGSTHTPAPSTLCDIITVRNTVCPGLPTDPSVSGTLPQARRSSRITATGGKCSR
jgi:hypothetical protein